MTTRKVALVDVVSWQGAPHALAGECWLVLRDGDGDALTSVRFDTHAEAEVVARLSAGLHGVPVQVRA